MLANVLMPGFAVGRLAPSAFGAPTLAEAGDASRLMLPTCARGHMVAQSNYKHPSSIPKSHVAHRNSQSVYTL